MDDATDFLNPTTAFKGNFNVTAELASPGSFLAKDFYSRPDTLVKSFFTRDYFRFGSFLNIVTDFD